MLKLGGTLIPVQSVEDTATPLLLKVSTHPQLPEVLRRERAYLVGQDSIPPDYRHYLIPEALAARAAELEPGASFSLLPEEYHYLGHDDIVRLSADRQKIRVLFRARSPHNSLLMTEQCNHYCLMCSQPPKRADDSWLLDEIEALIPLIPKDTPEIGFTGGEPTLNRTRFLHILGLAKAYLPRTAVHVLSNGRSFADPAFAAEYGRLAHPDLMVGIPLYSDDPARHDYIVQAKGAFDETVRGILNLKRLGQRVEVRIVLHQQSIPRLPQLCEFIARNLLFVDHVALMGLEMMGFTRANLDALWIAPADYRDVLSEAVAILARYRLKVSVYNHQLCLVNDDILPHYRKSISDWKNEYAPECQVCARRAECGGFFASGVQHGYSKQLRPFRAE